MGMERDRIVAVVEPWLCRVDGRAVDGVRVWPKKKSIRASKTWQLAAMRLTAPISSQQRVINTKTTPAGDALRPFYFSK